MKRYPSDESEGARAMTDTPKKSGKAILVAVTAFALAAIAVFVFFPYMRSFLYIFGLVVVGLFALVKLGRGHAALVLLALAAIGVGSFFLYKEGMRALAVETQFRDIGRSLKVASVAKEAADIDAALAKLNGLRKNRLYTSRYEEKAQRIIGGDDLVYFRYSVLAYAEKGAMADLEKKFEAFKQQFRDSKYAGEFASYIDGQKKRLAALKAEEERKQAVAQEKRQAEEILAATD